MHHPDDAVLRYHLGLFLARQRRFAEARPALQEAIALDDTLFPAIFLLALLELKAGHRAAVDRLLKQCEGVRDESYADLLHALRRIRLRLRLRRWAIIATTVASIVALIAAGMGSPLGLPGLGITLAASAIFLLLTRMPALLPSSMQANYRLALPRDRPHEVPRKPPKGELVV